MDGKELTGVLQRYCETYAICAEAAQSLQNDLAALLASPAADEFLALVAGYPAPDWDYQAQLTAAGALSEKAGIHPYVMAFLYCVALLPAAEKLWLEAGFTRQNFLDAFADLSYKLTECKKMYGIYGSFVADWFGGWYVPARFALGRLQFELVPCHCLPGMEDGFTLHGFSYPADTQLINVHIPSSGHLPHDSVVDAYRRAAAFFRQHFADQLPKDKPIAFVCVSWLLWPDGKWFLPQNTNVRPFMEDYTILYAQPDKGGNLWRTAYVEWKGDPDDLPEDSSYNRAWKKWMQQGGCCGYGSGVFLWDDEKSLPMT